MVRCRLWNASRGLSRVKRIVTAAAETGARAGLGRAVEIIAGVYRGRLVPHMPGIQRLPVDRFGYAPIHSRVDTITTTNATLTTHHSGWGHMRIPHSSRCGGGGSGTNQTRGGRGSRNTSRSSSSSRCRSSSSNNHPYRRTTTTIRSISNDLCSGWG